MIIERFKGIEAFLFDLGGVIVDIDPQRPIKAFKNLGFNEVDTLIAQSHHDGLFKDLERGDIQEKEFIDGLKARICKPVCDNEILAAWNSILVNLPIERVKILGYLHQNYPTYLLSNTNGIHQRLFSKMAEGYDQIEDLFTDVFYSYRLGCSKPDTKIYEKVIKESGLNPETTLFLDDSEINLKAAEGLGFKTEKVSTSNSLEKIFGMIK